MIRRYKMKTKATKKQVIEWLCEWVSEWMTKGVTEGVTEWVHDVVGSLPSLSNTLLQGNYVENTK